MWVFVPTIWQAPVLDFFVLFSAVALPALLFEKKGFA
jgi:hypothetical protein